MEVSYIASRRCDVARAGVDEEDLDPGRDAVRAILHERNTPVRARRDAALEEPHLVAVGGERDLGAGDLDRLLVRDLATLGLAAADVEERHREDGEEDRGPNEPAVPKVARLLGVDRRCSHGGSGSRRSESGRRVAATRSTSRSSAEAPAARSR